MGAPEGAPEGAPQAAREIQPVSANGYLLEVNGYTLHASWAAPFFVLSLDDPDADNYCPEPLLIHCETLEDARVTAMLGHGYNMVLDATFQTITAPR